MNPLYSAMPTKIFEEMSALARNAGAFNFSKDFSTSAGPSTCCSPQSRR
ncbi:hypothetical protein ACLBWH_18255 [Sphingomonas sp. M6A6_1c]